MIHHISMIDYDIINDNRLREFRNQIKQKLREGWELYGNHQTAYSTELGEVIYTQAMILYGERDDER